MKRRGKSRPCKPTMRNLSLHGWSQSALYDTTTSLPITYDGIDEDENDSALEDDNLNNVDLTTVIEESNIPLYEGSQTKLLVAVLLLFNCFTVFGVSNTCADEILNVITKLLPKGSPTTPSMHVKTSVVYFDAS